MNLKFEFIEIAAQNQMLKYAFFGYLCAGCLFVIEQRDKEGERRIERDREREIERETERERERERGST